MSLPSRGVTLNGSYSVIFKEKVGTRISNEVEKSYDTETGGILVGYYTADRTTVVITDAFPPPKDSKQSHTSFERGTRGLVHLLKKLWRRKSQQVYYVGEWHYHPSTNVNPSEQDKNQMTSISNNYSFQCKEPVLLIVGGTAGKAVIAKSFVFPRDKNFQEFILS